MQETQVRSLIWEDPNAVEQLSLCTTAAGPVLWGLGATATEPARCSSWDQSALEPVLHARRDQHGEGHVQHSWRVGRFPQLETGPCSDGDPPQPNTSK